MTGHVDEHGLFRHRYPELCGFGALAFFFFGHFHVLEKEPPPYLSSLTSQIQITLNLGDEIGIISCFFLEKAIAINRMVLRR